VDADHADCFFIMGANPFECHPPIFERIRRRRAIRPEARIICVDPRRTLTAERSDLHLAPIPGTDRYVVLDGANRTSAIQSIGCPHMLVQVVDYERQVQLYTWFHLIAGRTPATFLEEISRGIQLPRRLIEVDDVNLVPLFKNVRLHLRVPTLGLVTKVDPCFEKLRD
jgi:hypothetical protein